MSTRTFEHFDTRRLNAIPVTEVARRLGCNIRKKGTVFTTNCPWHDDHHPSLTLYERTDENRCHCFSCGKGGSVIDFVMQHEQWTFQEACRWLSDEFGISTYSDSYQIPRPKPRPVEKPEEPVYTYIPMEMVDGLVSVQNSLCQCLRQLFHPSAVEWLCGEYRLGCYAVKDKDDYTVFPSIDRNGRVHDLKVQHYDTDFHSERFAHSDGLCFWLGSRWAEDGLLPKDAQLDSSCLFGEHLLSRYPDSVVALVESPKNALFGALAHPRLTWVATGSKNMLKRDVLKPLRGRNVIVIPDCDAVEEWSQTVATMKDLTNFTVSDFCQRMAPESQPKYDIADYIVEQNMPF